MAVSRWIGHPDILIHIPKHSSNSIVNSDVTKPLSLPLPPFPPSSALHARGTQICAIWKRSRQAILAAAVASSDAAAAGGAAAAAGAAAGPAAAAATAATDSVPSGRRRVCAVGAGQGRDGGGGKMAKLYYHQLAEKAVRSVSLVCFFPKKTRREAKRNGAK